MFVLNGAATIERALTSVLSEDQPPVELLVMDGGSTDGTVDIIRRYESRIKYWHSHRDGNAVLALNEGVRRSTRDVIALLPCDDWMEPGALHLVSAEFAADPELGVLSAGTRIVQLLDDGTLQLDAQFTDAESLDFTMENLVKCPLTAGRFILRRLYQEAGEYDPTYHMSNDLDFLIRVLLRRPKSKVLPQLVYTYRRHAGSRTLSGAPGMVMDMMRYNIRVAEQHLAAPSLATHERDALIGLHGRASARLAWMSFVRGDVRGALARLARSTQLNWAWPFEAALWLGQKWFSRLGVRRPGTN
jgi:glycosyltransferase involved in cell wall biosynthesis